MFVPQLDRNAREGLQKQIMRQIIAAIASGMLRPNTPLPGIREASVRWGVSRNTVVLVFEHLETEGYLQTRPSRGTFIHPTPPCSTSSVAQLGNERGAAAASLGEPSWPGQAFIGDPAQERQTPDGVFNLGFGSNMPLYRFPAWQKTIERLLLRDNWKRGGEFQPNAGLPFLRSTLARWLHLRHGVTIDPQQIIIVTGLQQAHSIIAHALLKTGDHVILEDPCYPGKRQLYEKLGMHVINGAIDRKGIKLADLAPEQARLLCVNPGCHIPTNVTLSLPRRKHIAALAMQDRYLVFEEAMYDLLSFEKKPTPSLLSLTGGRNLLHAGLFAPCLGGGLMLGYLVVPWSFLPAVLEAKLLTGNGLPWLEQEALARMLDSGELDNALRRTRVVMMRRREVFMTALERFFGRMEFCGTEHAPRLSWFLPGGFGKVQPFLTEAEKAGIRFPGNYAAASSRSHPGLPDLPNLVSHGYGEISEEDIPALFSRLSNHT
ncbi:PLP-dependent aminotransferase family protein [Acetobacter fabarum]|uniref:aminotransferase-like domain-containing protein n=1 Tax=Acetobacter fabarum TaxID=483199 RepID=UPI0039E96957